MSKSKIKRNVPLESIELKLIGINANAIMGKIDTFENWLSHFLPDIFTIQETKVGTSGQIKSKNMNLYQLYEQIRTVNPGLGGGLCVGVHKKLPSTILREGGEEVECISVQVEIGQQEMVVVCGYGPQLYSSPARKEQFWEYLDREVEEASREENRRGRPR